MLGLARPVPPEVIPRPPSWRLGAPSPREALSEAGRTGITIDRTLGALGSTSPRGPVPADPGADPFLVPATVLDGGGAATARDVNAGVLVVLFEEAGEARLILTRRSTSMRTHRGEVSFPGGRIDPGEDAMAAALREAYEEIALDPAPVTVVVDRSIPS